MGRKKTAGPDPDRIKQDVLAAVRASGRAGITSQQLALKLGFKDKSQRYLIFDALDSLLDSASVRSGKKGRFTTPEARGSSLIEGNIDIIGSGAGFVRTEGTSADIYVQARDTGLALHGDRVRIKLASAGRGRREGKVVEVVSRRRSTYVGVVRKMHGRLLMVPDDNRIQQSFYLAGSDAGKAKEGEKVIVELNEWNDPRDVPRARVLRILGTAGEHNVEMHAILAEFGLPLEFPPEVLAEAETIRDGRTEQEIATRRDMRQVPTLTIDPEDAKDLDDALSLQKLDSGLWEVGIHIADVSHYVRPGSAVDAEGLARATSVYLVDRVVPMLPERLSNDLCSLNPDEDKLTFSAIFQVDDKAHIKHEWFGRTVIRSRRRFAYAEAQAIIDGGSGHYAEEVMTLHRLAQHLRKERLKHGALEIVSNEMKFRLDEKGRPVEVYEKVMSEANWLIEEFMLLANKRVATWVSGLKKGGVHRFVYRIHDLPDDQKVIQLRALAKSFGYSLVTKKQEDLPHAINRLMQEIKGKEEEQLIKQVVVRTMAKAIYSTDNIGHYGLGFDHYTHFTSPIRRYPDLLVHRAMAHYLSGGKPLDKEKLEEKCVHSSQQEKRASDAERASIRYKQAEYLMERIGQSFHGTISGITSWGVYVQLTENKCEGMIPIRDIPGDNYRFDEERYRLVGTRHGGVFRLGDEIQVTVRAVDLEKKTVDLAVEGAEPEARAQTKFKRRANSSR